MLNQQLLNSIKNRIYATVEEAQSGDKKEYDAFMKKMLKKYNVSSPKELSDDQKKKFFDEIDKEWESDAEKEGVEEQIDMITDQVYSIIEENAKSGGKKEYDAFMKKMMAKYKISSPKELSGDKKKKFFDEVDKGWKSDKEEAGVEESLFGNYNVDPGTLKNLKWKKKTPIPKNQARLKVFGQKGFDLLVKQLTKERIKFQPDPSDSTSIFFDKKDLKRVEKLAKFTGYKTVVEQ